MNEFGIFCSGVALGGIVVAAVLILYGQWLFASGQVFASESENLHGMTDDEIAAAEAYRLWELQENREVCADCLLEDGGCVLHRRESGYCECGAHVLGTPCYQSRTFIRRERQSA